MRESDRSAARLLRARFGKSRRKALAGTGLLSPVRHTPNAFAKPSRRPILPVMTPVIRSARPADVPVILVLIRGLADYEKLSHEVEATEERLGHSLFPADGSPAAAHCVLAEVAGQPAGFALYFFNYSTFLAKPGLYLEDLFVQPAFRGQGLGKALLLHLAKLANARGCGRMEWTVLDWNQPAIDFYESLGARRLKEWQHCRLSGPALQHYA
jgi:GNAT superfamily N-acetyltransferase